MSESESLGSSLSFDLYIALIGDIFVNLEFSSWFLDFDWISYFMLSLNVVSFPLFLDLVAVHFLICRETSVLERDFSV